LAFPHLAPWGIAVIGGRVETFGLAVILMLAQAAGALLLPTLFMGAMFPFGIAAYEGREAGLGRRVGNLYATNTAGNIAGAVLVGFVLISLIGVRHSMVALVGVNLLLAAAIFAREAHGRLRLVLAPAA